jgi:glycosyltransferase involved in cell wall biosynthesis
MNIPSHYQSSFFRALWARADVDLAVRYFHISSDHRQKEGWGLHTLQPYERSIEGLNTLEAMLETVPDWRKRIHVINSNFSKGLVDFFCREKIRWVHWSEMPGIRLAEAFGYRIWLYHLLNPLMLLMKYREGRCIKKNAMGAFAQGSLAERSFRFMGVPQKKIAPLYYSPDPLITTSPCAQVMEFTRGRRAFLYVGSLCRRKGIDVLLHAFSKLYTSDWCLVLCGFDTESGHYASLAVQLGIEKRVLFLGAYPAEKISEVYGASDVFILPSRFDGWGAVLNEASSLGLPLIATDMCGAAWHVIKNGKNGFRVRADSISELQQAMELYVKNPSLIKKHGEISKSVFFDEFSPDKNAERLLAALRYWNQK